MGERAEDTRSRDRMKRIWAAFAVLIAAAMLIAGCPSTPENKNPTAGITVSRYILFVGGTVDFNGSTSKDPDGKIKSYTWDFGDGTAPNTTTSKGVAHTFSSPGAFNVSLQVKDDKGAKSKTVNEIIVVAPLPTVSTNMTLTMTNLTFSIDTSALGGRITEYSWNFGDGTAVAKGASVEHPYIENGTFRATLTVSYNGQTAATTLDIKVENQAPTANITISSQPPHLSNKLITFSGYPSGDPDGSIKNWTWEFGDNTNDYGMNVTHSFKKPGTYPVKLTVTDNDGATGTTTVSLNVEKDLIITEVTIASYKDDNNVSHANVTIKFDNKGDAKVAGSINITVKSYQSDKTTFIEEKSKSTTGLVDNDSTGNTVTVRELEVSNIDPDTTQYWVELSYMDNAIDSGWYPK